jgi:methionine-R-sulfoxide reductase
MKRRVFLSGALSALVLGACRTVGLDRLGAVAGSELADVPEIDAELENGPGCPIDTALQGRVDWASHFEEGIYRCAVCGQPLFESDTKYDPGTPWPSFWVPIEGAVVPVRDRQEGRISESAVECSRCSAPLGDIYREQPTPTGLRYCIVSAALEFEPAP